MDMYGTLSIDEMQQEVEKRLQELTPKLGAIILMT